MIVEVKHILIGLIIVLIVYVVYLEVLKSNNDINQIYLQEQSNQDSTRLFHESPIYKSNKLDYGGGLRIGLDIRYDHYKIRHGNLNDIWSIVMNGVEKKGGNRKGITINDSFKSFRKLNYQVNKFQQFLIKHDIKSLKINQRLFLKSFDLFVIIISSFINQTIIEFYDNYKILEDDKGWIVIDDEEKSLIDHPNYININDQTIFNINDNNESSDFPYEYNPSKDKGVCFKLIGKTLSGNPNMISTVEFTQLNIISAIASSLKHLPPGHELSSKDSILVVQSSTNKFSSLMNEMVKILMGLTSNAKVYIHNDDEFKWDQSMAKIDPTILSINSKQLSSVNSFKSKLNSLQPIIHKHNLKSLEQGRFPSHQLEKLHPGNLRIIYLSESITSPPQFSFADLNELRSILSTRIIYEFNTYNVSSAIIHTDMFDYRDFKVKCKSWGCLSQSLEIKLINVDEMSKIGDVMIRGFIIGKTMNKFSTNNINEDNGKSSSGDGFMPLVNVRGKWGNDGCLYIV
ncbi:hypothetical protein DFJ63DRAFT_313209 [Scheffersomyces coipomensis]|uniref:uncharacterized protein n=1 Tax=Scheffersomyces coipomensis TaxID=1788519 RepID=UPI00315CB9C4